MGQIDKTETTTPFLRLKNRLTTLSEDGRYRFMFGGILVHDNMASILSSLFRVPVNGKPITILDLSGIPSDILNIVVSVISRITFDFGQFANGSVPLLLVCEEAHRYIPENSELGFEPTKRILSRIAKEGRKYGVSLCIVSQRPSDLSLTALSQCNTIFALRLTSQQDQDIVRGAMPDWGDGLTDFLPSLRNAEAIVVGEGISIPARVRFDELAAGERPAGGAASFSKAWQCSKDQSNLVQAVIKRWRSGAQPS
jgi:DNA helicase HerA-like ATPase